MFYFVFANFSLCPHCVVYYSHENRIFPEFLILIKIHQDLGDCQHIIDIFLKTKLSMVC